MNWKFWQKDDGSRELEKQKKMAAPRTIPEPVARYMVVDLKENAEWVWRLMAVERPMKGKKHEFDVRVYESGKVVAAGCKVMDYASFDDHPEQVVLECWYHRKTGEVVPAPDWEREIPKAA